MQTFSVNGADPSSAAASLGGFSLAQSTNEAILRSAGVNACNLLLASSHPSGASSPFSFADSNEPMKPEPNTTVVQKVLDSSQPAEMTFSYASVGLDGFFPSNEGSEGRATESGFEWPADEEAKYQEMIRLLQNSAKGSISEETCSSSENTNQK